MNSNKIAARTFGVFFILAFAAYGTGSGIIQSLLGSGEGLAVVYTHKNTIILCAILMGVVHAFLNVGLAVIMVPLLKPYNKTVTYGYLSAAITATVMLIIGAVFLLLLVPLSDEFVKAGSIDTVTFQTLFVLCQKGNYYAYQVAMAIWGMGGMMLCYLLYKSAVVPRPLTIWGFMGYTIFICGTILELFGYNIGVQMDMPGGLFEISLGVWLIVKGFNFSKATLQQGLITA